MSAPGSWLEVNQRGLLARLARLRETLIGQELREAEPIAAPALDVVASAFSLSPFEQDLLLLVAATELDSSFATLFAQAAGDSRAAMPTFSLALAKLRDPHWSAITPAAPLR